MLNPGSIRMSVWIAAFLFAVGGRSAFAADSDDTREAFFEQRVRPVLVENCYECHSAKSKKLKGGLRLDQRSGLLKGGETRPAVIPGNPGESLLIESIGYGNPDLQMPPKRKLPDSIIADLNRWVADGAFFPDDGPATTEQVGKPESGNNRHWAFQPIRDSVPPSSLMSPTHAVPNPIDGFIGAKLAENGLSLARRADRRLLIRRATFDLTGLPPAPHAIEAFLADSSPGAFGGVLDQLLASPQYGERWGRWWLDVARYADSNGQDENKVMANAWRYRDWVIRAFNQNLSFDAFITEQLAGDLLPTNGLSEQAVFDRWIATGLLVLGPKMLAEQDKPKLLMDLVDEQIDVVSRAFLGLTVSCARCHDHKFDPIPTRDYYALAGIFRSTKTMANLAFVSKFNERRIDTMAKINAIEVHEKKLAAKTNQINQAIIKANEQVLEKWRSKLPELLAIANTTNCPGSARSNSTLTAGAILSSNRTERLRALIHSDTNSNTTSQRLRRALLDPDLMKALSVRQEDASIVSNGVRIGPGRVGAAFVATGTNHLELPSSAEIEPSQLTVEAWMRTEQFPEGGDERRWLVAKNANEYAEGHYALMIDRDRAGACLNIGGGPTNVFTVWSDKGTLKPNQWHYLALTYDGMVLRIILDGNSVGELSINRPRVPGNGPLVLGRRPDGFVSFKGRLDEVRVHRRALTREELKRHFDRPESARDEDASTRWDFNELAEAERAELELAEVREALFGPDGVFGLTPDMRADYPLETLEAIASMEKDRDALKAATPPPPAFALAVEDDHPVDLPVHIRGSHLTLDKTPVPRGFVQAVYRSNQPPQKIGTNQSGRLELARWLTHAENPLTARVIVNRIWQAHFGEGLVRTSDSFGVRGEEPSHPELLDWLAREFIRSGWNVKQLHRLILTSAAWQQTGTPEGTDVLARAFAIDPDNRLLWRFPRQRLEAEMIRDALLAVSGRLDLAEGGSVVNWKNDEYTPADEVSASSVRRSVYLPVVRDRVFDMFTIFDFANPSVGVSKRAATVVSHQALFFLNSPLVKESARAFARNLLAGPPVEDNVRIRKAYERALSRPPSPAETERALRFLKTTVPKDTTDGPLAVWSAWCQVLFSANEFIYRE
ncbi:MAG: Planctomycete cytochrome [Verrucomicrobiales bacterium]|nr:Planctomycete cytochrome [Verrucomicrobiales bacterium]